MRITKNDPPEVVCAKKAAMICQYAIKNPLHVFFEDGNVHKRPMNFERGCNEDYRSANGEFMYEFVREFLDEFEALPVDRRWPVYRLYRKKAEYLSRKWRKKIRMNSAGFTKLGSMWYHHALGDDGHIYVTTNIGIQLLVF